LVAQAVRRAVGSVPYVVKIGHLNSPVAIESLLAAVGDVVDGLVMTNSVATTVGSSERDLMFDRQKRGICGTAIRDASIGQVRQFAEAIRAGGHHVQLIGVGGISTAEDLQSYLDAGAQVCQLATSAMIHPAVGIEIREALSGSIPIVCRNR
jgi:dihydroorotate dehydrogenase